MTQTTDRAPAGPTDSGSIRTIGLAGATGAGIGAIVGGGILVLAGVAFAHAGPGAILAFALNGAVAVITAMSFAEMACAFPESGGAYNFAKKVLSVRAAFAVGWILWFAYIVAGVLYALGFASYAVVGIGDLWSALGGEPAAWLLGRRGALMLAAAATVVFALALVRKATGGGQWATVGKIAVFGLIIVAGIFAVARNPWDETTASVRPFLPGGTVGLISAMGFTFIALQGFDLVAAIAGEVKRPRRTIPRAMFLSLGAALVVYLPLLFVVSAVGVAPGETIQTLSAEQPETVMATAVGRFMGRPGYWLVIVAAVLSTLSALHANVLAASRVAHSMARDRTLPVVLGTLSPARRTPVVAIHASALAMIAILLMIPNLAAAGAAASLIFLISFFLAHVTGYLARKRGGIPEGSFRSPYFPLVPVVGGLACASLAVFQAVVVPSAAGIVIVWLGLGAVLYFALFASRAETADASLEAWDPTLARLRGRSPLVLVPVANPAHASSLIDVANALAPPQVGRVLLLTIVPTPGAGDDDEIDGKIGYAQEVIRQALTESFATGHAPEALVTAAAEPWTEIARVAKFHRCESLLLGLGSLSRTSGVSSVEGLMGSVDCDVALMKAPPDWDLRSAKRVLVPVGGRGVQHGLRARLLGSICRSSTRHVTFLRVLPQSAGETERRTAQREIDWMAKDKVPGEPHARVVLSDDPKAAILEHAANHDLVVLGLRRLSQGRVSLAGVARDIAIEAPCATIFLSRRR